MLCHGLPLRLQRTQSPIPRIWQKVRTYTHPSFTKVRGLDVCRVHIVPTHKLSYSAEAIIKDPSHVLEPVIRQRYGRIKGRYDEFEEGLWLMFTSNPMHKKKVVRSWARRRVAQAVIEQLRVRGFDGKGRKIGVGGIGGLEGKTDGNVPDGLVGTVSVEVMNQSVEIGFPEVQRQAGFLVEKVMKICGRYRHSTTLKRRSAATDGSPYRDS